MRFVLIVNPVSGPAKDERNINRVLAYFRKHGHSIEQRQTAGPGDASTIAHQAAQEGFDTIIIAGGDGTINEALNGLIDSPVKLAILPWGTGNVFAQEMGFPSGLGRLCRVIRRGASLRLDLGTCNGRAFLLMAGSGLDAYSLKIMELQGLKRQFGVFAYALSAVRALFRYRFPELEARLPNGQSIYGSFILVSNTSRYGSFFSFSPAANPIDGKLNLFVLRQRSIWDTVLLAIRSLLVFAGTPRRWPGLMHPRKVRHVTDLEIHGPPGTVMQLDGDLADPLPVRIGILPQAVSIILPRRTIRRLQLP